MPVLVEAGVNVSLTSVSSQPADDAGNGTATVRNDPPTSTEARVCPSASWTCSRTASVAPGRPMSARSSRSPPAETARTPVPFVQIHCLRRPPSGGYQPVPYPTVGRTPRSSGPHARMAALRHPGAS